MSRRPVRTVPLGAEEIRPIGEVRSHGVRDAFGGAVVEAQKCPSDRSASPRDSALHHGPDNATSQVNAV